MQKQEEKSTVPGVWATLAAGFDSTAKHPWLLLLPMILDLFIWLGPRLRFQAIIEQIVANLPPEADALELTGQLLEIGPYTNLFTALSVPLVGVPTMFSGLSPEKTPLVSKFIDLTSAAEWLVLFLALSLFGLLLTAVYYISIAKVVSDRRITENQFAAGKWLARIGTSWIRLLGLAILFILAALIVYIPISIVGALLFLLNATLGMMVVLLAPLIIIWVAFYLSFSPPGITLKNRSLFQSVKESLQLVQTNLSSVLAIFLLILLFGAIIERLLILAENGTWLTVFNILIHAFVSTGFITAFFILYQDRAQRFEDLEKTPGSGIIHKNSSTI
jgi:hypothetical protein